MAKPKSTHRGHCQACGRIQAVNPDTMLLAKHGYRVAGFGFFNGVCQGADHQPLELERTYCDSIRTALINYAERMDAHVADLKSGKTHPAQVGTGRTERVQVGHRHEWREVKVDWDEGTKHQQEYAVQRAISHTEMEARHARSHENQLRDLAKAVHGKPLVERDDRPAPLKIEVGMTFTHKDQTWTIRSLVHRGFGRGVNPNYAVCVCEGVERPWTLSIRSVRNLIAK